MNNLRRWLWAAVLCGCAGSRLGPGKVSRAALSRDTLGLLAGGLELRTTIAWREHGPVPTSSLEYLEYSGSLTRDVAGP